MLAYLLWPEYEKAAEEARNQPEIDWDELPDEEDPMYDPEFWEGAK